MKAIDTPEKLKNMISQDVITVTISGSFTGIRLPSVIFSFSDGDELTFYGEKGDSALPLIKDALTDQGISVIAMSVRRPSLDDVFLHLVENAEDNSPFKLGTSEI